MKWVMKNCVLLNPHHKPKLRYIPNTKFIFCFQVDNAIGIALSAWKPEMVLITTDMNVQHVLA